MGRYVERVDNAGRLLRCVALRLSESDPSRQAAVKVLTNLSERAGLQTMIRQPAQTPATKKIAPSNLRADWLLLAIGDPKVINGVPANTSRLLYCAAQLRERMSIDHWRTVQRLAHAHEPAPQSFDAALAVLDAVLPACTALAGFAFDDMTRDDAWQFLVIGREIERLVFLCSTVSQVLALPADECEAVLDALLEIGNVSITYRARYQRQAELLPALDLILLDESNPHSVCYQLVNLGARLQRLQEHLDFKPYNHPHSMLQALRGLDLAYLEDILPSRGEPLTPLLTACERFAQGLSDEFTQRFFVHAGERPQTSVAA